MRQEGEKQSLILRQACHTLHTGMPSIKLVIAASSSKQVGGIGWFTSVTSSSSTPLCCDYSGNENPQMVLYFHTLSKTVNSHSFSLPSSSFTTISSAALPTEAIYLTVSVKTTDSGLSLIADCL